MKKRHPETVSFKENERLLGKKHYDQLCKFVEGCQDALSLASKNIDICREEIETTMKNTKNGKVIREGNEVVSLAAIHYVHYRSQRCITTPSKPKVELKYKYHYENA